MALQQLTNAVLKIYRDLLNIESSADVGKKRRNRTFEMIELLEDSTTLERKIAMNSLSKHEMFLLSSAILDGYALTAASGGAGFRIGDAGYLARSTSALRAKLLNKRERVEDFLFSTLVQAWHNAKESTQNIRDLILLDEYEEQQICDFKIDTPEGGIELIECKRIHPVDPAKISLDLDRVLDRVVEKVRSKAISKAKSQFAATEAKLGKEAKFRHVLVDISAYGEYFDYEKYEMHIEGFDPDKHVNPILQRIKGKEISGVDVVILCWTNVFLQNGVLIAKTFNSESVNLSAMRNPFFEFGGFTIELYPKSTTGQSYSEMRISSVVRSPEWIKTSWNVIADQKNFWKVGKEEINPDFKPKP